MAQNNAVPQGRRERRQADAGVVYDESVGFMAIAQSLCGGDNVVALDNYKAASDKFKSAIEKL